MSFYFWVYYKNCSYRNIFHRSNCFYFRNNVLRNLINIFAIILWIKRFPAGKKNNCKNQNRFYNPNYISHMFYFCHFCKNLLRNQEGNPCFLNNILWNNLSSELFTMLNRHKFHKKSHIIDIHFALYFNNTLISGIHLSRYCLVINIIFLNNSWGIDYLFIRNKFYNLNYIYYKCLSPYCYKINLDKSKHIRNHSRVSICLFCMINNCSLIKVLSKFCRYNDIQYIILKFCFILNLCCIQWCKMRLYR